MRRKESEERGSQRVVLCCVGRLGHGPSTPSLSLYTGSKWAQ